MKKRLLIAIILVGILVAGPLVVPRIRSLSAINRCDSEINIKTGQIRHARYLWYVKVSERVEDTILSTTLEGESVDVADIPAWHRGISSSPGLRHRPIYQFTEAFYQVGTIKSLFRRLDPDVQRRKRIARDILAFWQTYGGYQEAGHYLAILEKEADKRLEDKHRRFSEEPNAPGAKEEDSLADRKYRQALECYTLLHEQPEPETCWSGLLTKEREKTLSEAEKLMVGKLRSFARAFGRWNEEAPDPIIVAEDWQEVEAIVTRLCRDPILKSAYELPDPGTWNRLTVYFYHGNRCYVEMFFYYSAAEKYDGYACYVHLFKHQGKWEVLLIGHWIN